jgi:hypothetical protein
MAHRGKPYGLKDQEQDEKRDGQPRCHAFIRITNPSARRDI